MEMKLQERGYMIYLEMYSLLMGKDLMLLKGLLNKLLMEKLNSQYLEMMIVLLKG